MATKKRKRSLVEDIRALASKRNVSDVTLRGNDGETVPAARAILAARSDVFERMLLGDFAEAGSQEVRLGYMGATLRAVVQYCYTDELKELDGGDEEEARELVRIVAAADYFDISGLNAMAFSRACALMKNEPSLCCAVLDQATKQDATAQQLGDIAMQIIRVRPNEALLPDEPRIGVRSLSSSVLRKVIGDKETKSDAFTLFTAVDSWVRGDQRKAQKRGETRIGKKKAATTHGENVQGMSEEERFRVAKEIVSSIDLCELNPSQLANKVEPSGLVTMEKVFEAYKAHALEAEAKRNESGDEGTIKRCPSRGQDAIVVSGAGVPEVNGIYHCDGTGHKQYEKIGTWDGKEVKFQLLHEHRWFLCIKQQDDSYIDFYSIESSFLEPLPMEDWEVENGSKNNLLQGLAPSPVCIHLSKTKYAAGS